MPPRGQKLWKRLCQSQQQAGRQWEIVFVSMWRMQLMGAGSVLATHTTQRSHRPFELSLNSWHSADDSKGLAGINLHHVCLLHRFIDLYAWVCACGRESSFLPALSVSLCACVCVFMCIKYHTEGSANLIFPCDYKWISGEISEISQSSYLNPSGGREQAVVSELMTLIKSRWSIRLCCVCRMNMIMKVVKLLQFPECLLLLFLSRQRMIFSEERTDIIINDIF